MTDTLIGVIIGGVIGSIAPFATLVLGHYRWKREAKLEYLKAERTRLESLFEKTLTKFAEGMKTGTYSSDMSSDITVLMPKEVSDRYWEFVMAKDTTDLKCKHAYMDLAMEMKKVLASIDSEIRQTVS